MLCRDIQAFVFIFEEANRIVVEKPEYGFATYFFEIEAGLSIAAQVGPLRFLSADMAISTCCINLKAVQLELAFDGCHHPGSHTFCNTSWPCFKLKFNYLDVVGTLL